MAIKILSEVITPSNLVLTDLVATAKSHASLSKQVLQDQTKWFLTSVIFYYANEASVGVANEIFRKHVRFEITQADLEGNIIALLYSKLKNEYDSTEDC